MLSNNSQKFIFFLLSVYTSTAGTTNNAVMMQNYSKVCDKCACVFLTGNSERFLAKSKLDCANLCSLQSYCLAFLIQSQEKEKECQFITEKTSFALNSTTCRTCYYLKSADNFSKVSIQCDANNDVKFVTKVSVSNSVIVQNAHTVQWYSPPSKVYANTKTSNNVQTSVDDPASKGSNSQIMNGSTSVGPMISPILSNQTSDDIRLLSEPCEIQAALYLNLSGDIWLFSSDMIYKYKEVEQLKKGSFISLPITNILPEVNITVSAAYATDNTIYIVIEEAVLIYRLDSEKTLFQLLDTRSIYDHFRPDIPRYIQAILHKDDILQLFTEINVYDLSKSLMSIQPFRSEGDRNEYRSNDLSLIPECVTAVVAITVNRYIFFCNEKHYMYNKMLEVGERWEEKSFTIC